MTILLKPIAEMMKQKLRQKYSTNICKYTVYVYQIMETPKLL